MHDICHAQISLQVFRAAETIRADPAGPGLLAATGRRTCSLALPPTPTWQARPPAGETCHALRGRARCLQLMVRGIYSFPSSRHIYLLFLSIHVRWCLDRHGRRARGVVVAGVDGGRRAACRELELDHAGLSAMRPLVYRPPNPKACVVWYLLCCLGPSSRT